MSHHQHQLRRTGARDAFCVLSPRYVFFLSIFYSTYDYLQIYYVWRRRRTGATTDVRNDAWPPPLPTPAMTNGGSRCILRLEPQVCFIFLLHCWLFTGQLRMTTWPPTRTPGRFFSFAFYYKYTTYDDNDTTNGHRHYQHQVRRTGEGLRPYFICLPFLTLIMIIYG